MRFNKLVTEVKFQRLRFSETPGFARCFLILCDSAGAFPRQMCGTDQSPQLKDVVKGSIQVAGFVARSEESGLQSSLQ